MNDIQSNEIQINAMAKWFKILIIENSYIFKQIDHIYANICHQTTRMIKFIYAEYLHIQFTKL